MLGGVDNVLDLAAVPGRLLLKLARQDVIDESGLAQPRRARNRQNRRGRASARNRPGRKHSGPAARAAEPR